jgi:hypothetical protein
MEAICTQSKVVAGRGGALLSVERGAYLSVEPGVFSSGARVGGGGARAPVLLQQLTGQQLVHLALVGGELVDDAPERVGGEEGHRRAHHRRKSCHDCNVIEAPWLVNGGHGATLRHHSGTRARAPVWCSAEELRSAAPKNMSALQPPMSTVATLSPR